MKKCIVLIDFAKKEDWAFLDALKTTSREVWEVVSGINNRMHGNVFLNLKRYAIYFLLPAKVFFKRNEIKKILAWQQFYGLVLAFYFRLFHVKNVPEITIMTFIYKPKKGVIGAIYQRFMRYIVQSGYIKSFIVFSCSEPTYYAQLFNVSESLFKAVNLGIEDKAKKYGLLKKDNNRYLSAGRSNRDYKFLRNAWGGVKYKLDIVCDEAKKQDTNNITYFTNCHGDDYMNKLAECHAVIIPLEDEKISSGQLVILQAMMLGKPVIVTKGSTATDYIVDGYNGIVIEKDKNALINALEKLDREDEYNSLSQNARDTYEKQFSLYAMGLKIGSLL